MLRRHVVPVSFAATAGMFMASRTRPLRLDSFPTQHRDMSQKGTRRRDGLDPDMIKQMSSGSVSGSQDSFSLNGYPRLGFY